MDAEQQRRHGGRHRGGVQAQPGGDTPGEELTDGGDVLGQEGQGAPADAPACLIQPGMP